MRSFPYLATAAALLLVSSSCDSEPMGPADDLPDIIESLPRALTPGEGLLISASNRFGFALLAELVPEATDNLFFSPLSAHLALGMALNGAQDSTLTAMRTVLGFDGPGAAATIGEINGSYTGLLNLLASLDPAVTIEVANSVWYEPTFPFRTSYLQTVGSVFSAEVQSLDFSAPGAHETINAWVSQKTAGRIPAMLDGLDPAEVMMLLNAIYFDGDWRVRFDPGATADASFQRGDGTTRTVEMMVREEGDLDVAFHDTHTVVDLPYGGSAFSMTILVPAPGVSLSTVLDGLDASRWADLMDSLQPGTSPVRMPRFEIEWEKQLKGPLSALGMGVAFVPGDSDFGGMLEEGFDPQAAGTDLHITRVQQKAYVRVDEEGTEAAAATSVGVGVTSAPLPVVVDRPFLFALRERLTGTVLFLGVVNDPPGI